MSGNVCISFPSLITTENFQRHRNDNNSVSVFYLKKWRNKKKVSLLRYLYTYRFGSLLPCENVLRYALVFQCSNHVLNFVLLFRLKFWNSHQFLPKIKVRQKFWFDLFLFVLERVVTCDYILYTDQVCYRYTRWKCYQFLFFEILTLHAILVD